MSDENWNPGGMGNPADWHPGESGAGSLPSKTSPLNTQYSGGKLDMLSPEARAKKKKKKSEEDAKAKAGQQQALGES